MAQSTFSMTQHGRHEPFELQVSRGQVPYHSAQNIFGYGTTPATAGLFRTVWENMSTTDYVFPSSATTMTLTGGAGDTATITIVGLDANYNVLTENLVLNGATGVTTVNSYFRINSMFVATGSATNPSNTVTLTNGGVTYAQINTATVNGVAGSVGTSQMAVYTVPAGSTFQAFRFGAYSSFNGNTSNYTTYRAVANLSSGVQRIVVQTPFNTTYEVQRHFPFPYVAGTDLRFQIASSAATAAVVSVNIGGVLVANEVTSAGY